MQRCSTGKYFKTSSDLKEYLDSVSPMSSPRRPCLSPCLSPRLSPRHSPRLGKLRRNVIRTLSTHEWLNGKQYLDRQNPIGGDMLAVKEKTDFNTGKKTIFYIQKMEDGLYLYDYMEVNINAEPKFTYKLYDSDQDDIMLSGYELAVDS